MSDIRLLSKFATKEQMLGAHGAQDQSVLNVREDLSTGATKQMPLEVEFRKKSIEKKHQAIKVSFFNELLKLLETMSWSEELINLAEANIGLDSGYHHIIFPSGIQEIICSFEEWLDSCMLEKLAHLEKPKKIKDKIALALEIRILGVMSKKAALRFCSYYLIPTNIIIGTEIACHSCDIIWKYAGDKSTDFNYYTKRGLLLGVYMAARTFYFADNSENHKDTKEFIKNALDNIINIASFKNNIKMPKMEDIPIFRLFS